MCVTLCIYVCVCACVCACVFTGTIIQFNKLLINKINHICYSCYDPIWNKITSDKVGSNDLFDAYFFSIRLGVDDFINFEDLLGDMLLEEQC